MSNPGWRLIAPAEDWQHPMPLEECQLGLLLEVGQRLGLRVRKDEVLKKLYLGLPQVSSSSAPGDGVGYPSGKTIALARLSEAEAARYGSTGVYEAAPLLAARVDDPLSRHFRAGEFFPHDPSYRYLRVSPELVRRLEEIRQALGGQPLTIHSAYRPPAYNQAVGGVSNSTHIDGLAADISVVGVSTERLHQVADQVIGDGGGVGYYPAQQFVHLDVRGHRARWTG